MKKIPSEQLKERFVALLCKWMSLKMSVWVVVTLLTPSSEIASSLYYGFTATIVMATAAQKFIKRQDGLSP
jgi:hypothetical protein